MSRTYTDYRESASLRTYRRSDFRVGYEYNVFHFFGTELQQLLSTYPLSTFPALRAAPQHMRVFDSLGGRVVKLRPYVCHVVGLARLVLSVVCGMSSCIDGPPVDFYSCSLLNFALHSCGWRDYPLDATPSTCDDRWRLDSIVAVSPSPLSVSCCCGCCLCLPAWIFSLPLDTAVNELSERLVHELMNFCRSYNILTTSL